MILQLGLQILLPAFLLVSLWRGKLGSRLEWLLNVLAVSAALLFLFLTARWDFTSYYLRFLPAFLLVPAAMMSYRRVGRLPTEDRNTKPSAMFASGAILLVFSCLSVIEILNGEGVPIKLGGRFLVRNSLFNGH